jgi:putative membrane protein
MKFILKLLILIISNALALYVASKLIPGFEITADYIGFLKVGLVLGVINALIRPIIKLLSFPLIIITFGLFSLAINIFLLYYTSYLFDFFTISSLTAGIFGLLVVSLVNSTISAIFRN